MNVLVSSAGRRVSLVKFFMREVRKISHDSKVYTTDLHPELSSACQVSDGGFKVIKVTEEGALEELLGYCKELAIDLLIPTIDTELLFLSKHNEEFKKNGTQVIVSNTSLVEACRDKRLTNAIFNNLGIKTPTPIDVHKPVFPIFAKPYDGSLSKGIVLINNKDELTDEILSNPKLIFMEYLSPEKYNEYTVDMYYDKNHELVCAVPRLRIEVRTGEVNKAVTRKNELYNLIIEKMKTLEGAVGCLTVQFFVNKDDQSIYGIEINPRFGGGYPLAFIAGANYPKYIIDEWYYDKKLSFYNDWKENLLMLRYDDEVIVPDYV